MIEIAGFRSRSLLFTKNPLGAVIE